MTPFAGINRITSPYGYREYWYNGRLIKEQHKGQDIVAFSASVRRSGVPSASL